MAVETALHLLESGENVRQGGFHTPASAGGNALIKRLVDTGSTMRFFNIKWLILFVLKECVYIEVFD
jgi:short subunit dehydrogenase-like uncharacterized protein